MMALLLDLTQDEYEDYQKEKIQSLKIRERNFKAFQIELLILPSGTFLVHKNHFFLSLKRLIACKTTCAMDCFLISFSFSLTTL